MDFAGAFVGTAALYFLLRFVFPGLNNVVNSRGICCPQMFFPIIAIIVIFAFIGVVFLFFTKDEKEKDAVANVNKDAAKPNLDIRKYDINLRLFFVSQVIFTRVILLTSSYYCRALIFGETWKLLF